MRSEKVSRASLLGLAALSTVLIQFWVLDRPLPKTVGKNGQRAAIMGYRHQVLADTTSAYAETGHVLLVAYDGRGYGPLDSSDDVGAFVAVPVLTETFDLPLDLSIELFYTGTIVLGVFVGLVGWFRVCRTMASRVVAAAFIGHFAVVLSSQTDVYVVSAALSLAVPPWILWWSRRGRFDARLVSVVVIGSLVMATSQILRSHAATGLVLFGAVVFGTSRSFTLRQKAALAVAFAVPWFVPKIAFSAVQNARDEYLIAERGWTAEELDGIDYRHPFWHSVYIGLGFLPNAHGIEYNDMNAYHRAQELVGDDVVYMGEAYEAALRNECLRLLTTDPGFVVSVLFAKLVVVARFVLVFANVAILLVPFVSRHRREDLGFLAAMAFTSLFGLLVMPLLSYLLGLCALAAGFGAHVLVNAIDGMDAERAAERVSRDLEWFGRAWWFRRVRNALVIVIALVCLGETRSVASSLRNRIEGARRDVRRDLIASRLVESSGLDELPIRSSFRPESWTAANEDVRIEWAGNTAVVRMDETATGYQLIGPTLETERETQLVLRAEFEVLAGAIVLGALNDRDTWVAHGHYAVGEHTALDVVLADDTADVRFLVTNAGADERPRVRIRRIDVLEATGVETAEDEPILSAAARRDVQRERERSAVDTAAVRPRTSRQ